MSEKFKKRLWEIDSIELCGTYCNVHWSDIKCNLFELLQIEEEFPGSIEERKIMPDKITFLVKFHATREKYEDFMKNNYKEGNLDVAAPPKAIEKTPSNSRKRKQANIQSRKKQLLEEEPVDVPATEVVTCTPKEHSVNNELAEVLANMAQPQAQFENSLHQEPTTKRRMTDASSTSCFPLFDGSVSEVTNSFFFQLL